MEIIAAFNTRVFTFSFGYCKIYGIIVRIECAETNVTIYHNFPVRNAKAFSNLVLYILGLRNQIFTKCAVV